MSNFAQHLTQVIIKIENIILIKYVIHAWRKLIRASL